MADWTIISRETRDTLGEGVLWSAREEAVYWVDILAPAVNRLSLGDMKVQRWDMPEPLGWIAERAGGGFIAGFKSGFAELDLEPLTIRHIGDPEPHLPGNRMNDGKVDAFGHLWCGTMDMAEENDSGTLYRLGPNRRWERMDAGYRVPNGPCFSADGKWLYHTDTARRTVFRFARGEDGTIGDRAPFITFSEDQGYPDGMTVDADGGIWIAHWGGGRISRFHADGRPDRVIPLPARQITNIAFGGASLDRMFVTSATIGLDDAQGTDGALFEVDSGAIGLPPGLFAG
jgi:D-xylonolactonase